MQVRGGSKMAKEWCAFSPADMFLAYSRLSGAGFVHLGYLIVNGLFRFCFTPWELYPLGSLLLYSPKDSSVSVAASQLMNYRLALPLGGQ